MKNKLQPTRTTFSRNFQCKKAPRWLSKFFHFGTENREEQLKKAPCMCFQVFVLKNREVRDCALEVALANFFTFNSYVWPTIFLVIIIVLHIAQLSHQRSAFLFPALYFASTSETMGSLRSLSKTKSLPGQRKDSCSQPCSCLVPWSKVVLFIHPGQKSAFIHSPK